MIISKRLPPANDYERKVLANVDRHGWHCTSVFPEDGADTVRFSYTVGLFHSYAQPEFIIFGLDSKTAYASLNTLAQAAADERMFPLDKPRGELVDNYECVFIEVPGRHFNDCVFSALWFYAEAEFPLFQVVWPDTQGTPGIWAQRSIRRIRNPCSHSRNDLRGECPHRTTSLPQPS